jgi:hypothetical protein
MSVDRIEMGRRRSSHGSLVRNPNVLDNHPFMRCGIFLEAIGFIDGGNFEYKLLCVLEDLV